jgi:RNA polymerase sigma-70 factor (ECF subfamily)
VNGHSERSSFLDTRELDEFITLYGKAVYNFCYRLTGSKEDADDLYQETFLKAMEVRHKMDLNQNPKAFLISIAIRLRKNSRRKYAWRQRIAPIFQFHDTGSKRLGGTDESTPEDTVLSNELRCKIQEAAGRLSDKLKIPLYLYYTAEMSVDEIASALKIPPGTVKSRLYQARKALKKILEVELS